MVDKKTKVKNDIIDGVATVFLLYAAIAMLVTMLGFISGFAHDETPDDRVRAMGIAFISSIILAIPGISLLLHKSWARFSAIIVAIMSLAGLSFIVIQTTSTGDTEGAILPFISIIVFIGVIYYLTRLKVKEQFKPGGPNA
jgi:hypothetical protein